MTGTVLMAVSKWAVKNFNIGESLKNVGTDVLDKILWTPLKNKIIGFFDKEEEAVRFIQEVSERKAINESKPVRDIEDIYEEIRGVTPTRELFDSMVKFFNENADIIAQVNSEIKVENRGYTIVQNAGRDIFNIEEIGTVTFHSH